VWQKKISDSTIKINGRVRFIFQPSEEQYPGGAVFLAKKGLLKNVNFILGQHVWSDIDLDKIGIGYNVLPGFDIIKIELQNKK
jgi:amidohydrolase